MKILIVKTSSLGDIIHAFPTLAALKNAFAESEIDWVVESSFAPLLTAHPLIHKVHSINTKELRALKKGAISHFLHFKRELQKTEYDLLFDLQGNIKSSIPTFLARAKKKIGFKKAAEWPNLLFTDEKITPHVGQNIRKDLADLTKLAPILSPTLLTLSDKEKKLLDSLQHTSHLPPILVCPGSAWPNKQLPEDHLLSFLRSLPPSHFYLLQGNLEERAMAERLITHLSNATLLEKLPLPVLQHFMAKMELVISMDSLPLHLAATAGTATFSFFGPSSGKKYAPEGPKHTFSQGTCPYGITFETRCPKLRTCKTGACMKNFSNLKIGI